MVSIASMIVAMFPAAIITRLIACSFQLCQDTDVYWTFLCIILYLEVAGDGWRCYRITGDGLARNFLKIWVEKYLLDQVKNTGLDPVSFSFGEKRNEVPFDHWCYSGNHGQVMWNGS